MPNGANWRQLVSGYGQQIMQQPGRYSAIRENFGTLVRAAMQMGMTKKAETREEESKKRLLEFEAGLQPAEWKPTTQEEALRLKRAGEEPTVKEEAVEAVGRNEPLPGMTMEETKKAAGIYIAPETPSDWNLWKQAEDEVVRQLGGAAMMAIPGRREEYYSMIEKRYQELKTQFTGQLPIGEAVPPDIAAEYPNAYKGDDGNWYVDKGGKTYRIRRTP